MKIKSTANISIGILNDMIAENIDFEIIVQDSKNYPVGKKYDIFEMLNIKREIKKFLEGCPKRDQFNPNIEKEIFTYIYLKLAYMIAYDELARDIQNESSESFKMYSSDFIKDSSSLVGAMCNHYAMCSGFAEALRNLLAECGIEARYITGKKKQNGNYLNLKGHAWNQVKLDGEWFNCDVTHDRKHIIDESDKGLPYFLKSNQEFANYLSYPLERTPNIEPATKSISLENQMRLINLYREKVLKDIYFKEEVKSKPGRFKKLLGKLGLAKSSESEEKQFE